MRPFVNISLVLGAVLGAIYIIRDYIRDRTNTKVRLLKKIWKKKPSPKTKTFT